MIEIHLLEQLTAFAETGTLSAAAEQLHTSQPALTRSMKKLEQELDVSLFRRTKNHMELSDTGKVAAEYAARVLKEDEYFEERVRAYDRSLRTLHVGFCAPVPQLALTQTINMVFEGMTVSSDMSDDLDFLNKLKNGTYQLAVVHEKPEDEETFYSKKCGHEDLFISLMPSDPLTFYPEIHLKDLDGKMILLMTQIGFWRRTVHEKTPNIHYMLQIQNDSFNELASHSEYPCFSSSYFLNRGQNRPGRIDVALADPECHTDFYLVCLAEEKKRFQKLFDSVNEKTVL